MVEEAPVPLLQVDGLTKRFGGVVALDSLSLSVESGEVVGLIGPNGSGKTTFFNVTTGIYKPDAGRIAFRGMKLAGASPQTIHRAGISRTFQRSRLALPLSIFDNIMIGAHTHRSNSLWFNLVRRGAFKREYEEKLEAARALLKVFEPELADRMFEPVMGLPMIDRRRIEICRALISEPMLLFLDEPSAGMTHEETRALMDNILQVRAMRTSLAIVIVEHQMGVIERITGRCAVLNFGSKIAEGTYREVASDPEVQEAYLGAAS
jgi:branched-chain amino acid transport system ATP-binding protein/sulfate-transporting ATPase